MRGLVLGMVAGFGVVAGAWAQAAKPAEAAFGTVTGHVTYAETRQPGRLVAITLARRPDADTPKEDWSNFEEQLKKKTPARVVVVSGRTGLDGSFTMTDVPVGDYYAMPKMPGYVVPIGILKKSQDAADTAAAMADVPVVHVVADHAVELNLELHRGGVIAGRLIFEDGTPAAGVFAGVAPVEGPQQSGQLNPYYLNSAVGYDREIYKTDDEGRFRIVGLTPGKYVVKATVETASSEQMVSAGASVNFRAGSTQRTMIPVYAPGVFRRKDAQVFEIKGHEVFDGTTIEIHLEGLHTVRGRVLAKSDRHAPNFAGVWLVDEANSEFRRQARVQPDGSFQIPQVPAGSYVLKVNDAMDLEHPETFGISGEPVVLHKFAVEEVKVIVSDEDATVGELLLEERGKAK